ncbi:pyruvate formate-lyase-activating protein [Serpentinicella sp. ANB-PHB4]|uniref:pyruvate formate-lyase-activating protein n=1 Tax=Serpentinicella sp. ANB-PHB4 TaxID=3074076 RepID=UPI0028588BE5|nr:pyruvate formate-lyase-activating protein [Serpentinicella sp. ANB-PHB4]MDR5659450.1 pyruvate formate-lyase-activating protein [Serpentinicella sp. ANB-PHB4]
MKGQIHSFETMAGLDGPGMRVVTFLQGCPMRCIYCHNPDTWSIKQGLEMDSKAVLRKVLRYKSYFGEKGGVTLSGGEPLLQPKFAKEILKGLKENNVHTAIDTAGVELNDDIEDVLEYTDLVILDIKHTEALKFKEITGQRLSKTLSFLQYVKSQKIPLWIRQVVVPGINDTKEDMIALSELLKGIPSIEKVELLPYHNMGVAKWENLGLVYRLRGIVAPTDKTMNLLKEILLNKGFKIE